MKSETKKSLPGHSAILRLVKSDGGLAESSKWGDLSLRGPRLRGAVVDHGRLCQ